MIDKTKLNASYLLEAEARELRTRAADLELRAKRLHREHYDEEYDRCRACDGRGNCGEGLTSHSCGHCNCGLFPKGTLIREPTPIYDGY